MTPRLEGPASNPLGRLLFGLLGVVALVGAFFFGLVILAVAVGIGAIAWLAFSFRLWWLRRKVGRSGGETIDAEYRVVSRHRDDDRPPN